MRNPSIFHGIGRVLSSIRPSCIKIRPELYAEGDGRPDTLAAGVHRQQGCDCSKHEKFVTPPFVPPFTGQSACLVLKPINNGENARCVVCVGTNHPG
ncbi:MAG: hypothetical protein V3571_08310 [Pseudodesulfovibrio sp.]